MRGNVLLDLGLPDSSGTEAVTRLRACSPSVPVVVLTGDDRSSTGLAAIDCGAQDYLAKQHVAGELNRNLRSTDQVARYGGEEFAIVLSMTKRMDAKQVVLPRCRSISEMLIGAPRLTATLRCGVTEVTAQDDASTLVSRADQALYAAQTRGQKSPHAAPRSRRNRRVPAHRWCSHTRFNAMTAVNKISRRQALWRVSAAATANCLIVPARRR